MTTLKDIRERWEKATPGRWKSYCPTTYGPHARVYDENDNDIARCYPFNTPGKKFYHSRNAEAIANAPTDVAYLLDLVERAKPWIGRHVVTLTINRMEAIQIRELLDEMESAKGGE